MAKNEIILTEEVEKIIEALKSKSYRNYMMFMFYVKGYKIIDFVGLTIDDVIGKRSIVSNGREYIIDDQLKQIIDVYAEYVDEDTKLLFPSQKLGEQHPINRQRAYDVMNEECKRITGKTLFDFVKGRK